MHRKLTDDDVVKIKQLYKDGLTQKEISIIYNCSIMTISLWLKDNPQEIIRSKYSKHDFVCPNRCQKCEICIQESEVLCNRCSDPVRRYWDDEI